MKKVKIIADSTCDLTDELFEQYDIDMIPLCIIMDDQSYYDRTQVTPEGFSDGRRKRKRLRRPPRFLWKWPLKRQGRMWKKDVILYFSVFPRI